LKNLALPAFLADTYDNLLAVNHSMLALFEYSDSLIQQANQHFAGYNVLRFVFSQDSPFSESILENKEPCLLQSISLPNLEQSLGRQLQILSKVQKLLKSNILASKNKHQQTNHTAA